MHELCHVKFILPRGCPWTTLSTRLWKMHIWFRHDLYFFFFLIARQRGVVSEVRSTSDTTAQLPDDLSFFSLCTFISRGVVLWFASYFSASLLGFFLSRRLIYFFSQLRCCALFNSRGKNTAPALRKLLLHNYVIATQICFPLDDLMVHDSITFILQNYLMILCLFTAFCRLVGCCTTLLQTELNLYVWEIRAKVENSIGSPLEICAFFQLVSLSKFLS